jgi:FMN-dependent NADH-azoreductase
MRHENRSPALQPGAEQDGAADSCAVIDCRVIARGHLHGGSPEIIDYQESYLTAVFGFLGLADISFIRAEGVALGPEAAETAMRAAEGQLCEILGSGA